MTDGLKATSKWKMAVREEGERARLSQPGQSTETRPGCASSLGYVPGGDDIGL